MNNIQNELKGISENITVENTSAILAVERLTHLLEFLNSRQSQCLYLLKHRR